MSKSSKKLLITGGCSWTSPNEPYYVAAGMTKVWPNYVADWFEWDLLNVGHGGASNDLIHNRVIDAIHQNEDRDIVVMCAWSQAMRLTLFDMPIAQMTFNVHMPDLEPPFGLTKTNCQKVMRELLQLHVHEYDPRYTLPPAVDGTLNGPHGISLEDHYRMVARWSIRNIYMLNEYCVSKGIPIVHHAAVNILNGIEWVMNPEVNMKNRSKVYEAVGDDNQINIIYNKIKTWDNVVGKNLFEHGASCYEMYPQYFLCSNEQHPNDKGMALIAHSFVNKFIDRYEQRAKTEADYVYD